MIKILFLDTSALLSFFISDQGTPVMRWLLSSDNKSHDDTRYIINNRVVSEFEQRLQKLAEENIIKSSTADNILTLFNTHYKNRKFKIVGKDASVKETLDGMYQFLGRLSKPILVTSCEQQAAGNAEYKIINPSTQNLQQIELLLHQRLLKEKPTTSLSVSEFCQRLFRKTRMTFAL